MQRSVATFLQVGIVVLGGVVFAALLYEPTIEGVNANATTLSQIYFDDPFLAYIYFSFIAVFVGLYQAFKLVGYIGRDEAYSQKSVRALRTIKYCAMAFVVLIVAPVMYLFVVRPGDDIAGGVAVGLFMIFISVIVATAATLLERKLVKRVQTP